MDNDRAAIVETARTGDPVSLARLLVATPSVNPTLEAGGAGEAGLAEVASGLLRAWGFEVEVPDVAPGRPNVIGRLHGTGAHLVLNGHMDTVGVRGMTIDPYGARVDGGRLYGRGACDMKGGLAALLAVARRLAAGGPRPSLTVVLTADEEHASIGMAAFAPGCEADLAVVCEPTNLRVMPAHKGFVWVKAVFRGVAAHGSRPDVGIDAIRHAAAFVGGLDGYEARLSARPRHLLLGHGSVHAGTISGGSAESVYPSRCEVVIERRTLPGELAEAVERELAEVLAEVVARNPEIDGTLETSLARPGTEVGDGHPLVRGLMAACAHHGVAPRLEGMTAWVDAAYLNEAGVPAVCFGPGGIEQAHTDDEWVDLAEVGRCADVLETFARDLAR